jgi:UDP-GlcNAc:undecaprenyl-phosphate GlcNAc-1-phosphate transferase
MSPVAALVAFPAAALVIWTLLRSDLARRLVAAPSGDRWHAEATPIFGGVGIYLGFVAGVGAALAIGAVEPGKQLLGVVGGCSILFAAGLLDDIVHLNPVAKLAAQFGAATVVLVTGTSVQIVHNPIVATAIALVWLVGMTNAFNLLDNMDGLASTLAAIAAGFFAIDAVTVHPSHQELVLALAIGLACAGFIPFNLRRGKPAAVFMGDSGSQVLGFALASLGLASSWKVAGTTVATLILPILVLAVPILDTGLVTVVRLLEGRPVYQGGRDHTSHRLVYHGLSEKKAVALLGLVAAMLGVTSLAYNVLDDVRITLVGVLLTFVLLVQFASFLADIERRPSVEGTPGLFHTFGVHWRRLVEVVVDFALVTAAFGAAYALRFTGEGTINQRHLFTVTLPVLIAARYLAFIPFGLYRSVWRYAGARDAVRIGLAVGISEVVTLGFIGLTREWGDFSRSIFVIDALLCTVLVGASRFAERALMHGLASLRERDGRRALIVGAGRGGRSLMRELRETPGDRVVGFVDDNPALRRRRVHGVAVLGGLTEVASVIGRTSPDVVLVTIPNAPRERLDAVVRACAEAEVTCRFVRRDVDLDPRVILGSAVE